MVKGSPSASGAVKPFKGTARLYKKDDVWVADPVLLEQSSLIEVLLFLSKQIKKDLTFHVKWDDDETKRRAVEAGFFATGKEGSDLLVFTRRA